MSEGARIASARFWSLGPWRSRAHRGATERRPHRIRLHGSKARCAWERTGHSLRRRRDAASRTASLRNSPRGSLQCLHIAECRAGDRVLVRVDKSVEAIALYVACLRMGAVFVPMNTAYTTHELEYFIHDAEPASIVVRPDDFAAMASLLPEKEQARIQLRSGPRPTARCWPGSARTRARAWRRLRPRGQRSVPTTWLPCSIPPAPLANPKRQC